MAERGPAEQQPGRPVTPEAYEQALFERLLYEFPPPEFVVTRNDQEPGRYSRSRPRQLDVSVRRAVGGRPRQLYLVAEAKRHSRRIHVGQVEAFIGMLDDVACRLGILVSPQGPTQGATNRATAADVRLDLMSFEEALQMCWRQRAREVFPYDWAFHPQMGEAFRALEKGDSEEFIDALATVPYDEWLATVAGAQSHALLAEAIPCALQVVAETHPDSGWRFNAIQQLDDMGLLDDRLRLHLLSRELDPETRSLLTQL